MQKNADFHFHIYRAANLPTLSLLAPEYQKSRQGSRNHFDALDAIPNGNGKPLRQAIEKDLKDGAGYLLPLLDDI